MLLQLWWCHPSRAEEKSWGKICNPPPHPPSLFVSKLYKHGHQERNSPESQAEKGCLAALFPEVLPVPTALQRERCHPCWVSLQTLDTLAGMWILEILQGFLLLWLCLGPAGQDSCSGHGKESTPCAALFISAVPAAGN